MSGPHDDEDKEEENQELGQTYNNVCIVIGFFSHSICSVVALKL